MHYHQIIKQDTANGTGIRQSLFVSGCNMRCPGCHNEKGQDFFFGWQFGPDTMKEIMDEFYRFPLYEGLSILGGEPFDPKNIGQVTAISEHFKNALSDKTLWIYTGHTYEELVKRQDAAKLIAIADILVDGPFVQSLKNLNLSFRGSSNQRVIDLNATREQNKVVLYDIDVRHTGM